MRHPIIACLVIAASMWLSGVAADPAVGTAAAPDAKVAFIGGTPATVAFERAALAALPRSRVEALDHGKPGVWEGVRVSLLLEKSGAPLGDALRGRNLTGYLVVSAADGYSAVFALAEFDAAFGASTAILADTRDGKPLDAHEGPFRLILPEEKRPGRWVRQVERVELRFATPAPDA